MHLQKKLRACALDTAAERWQVQSLAGTGVVLRFPPGTTVLDGKRRLAAALVERPPAAGLTFVCAGRVLRDEEKLPAAPAAAGAEPGVVVHVVLALSRY